MTIIVIHDEMEWLFLLTVYKNDDDVTFCGVC